MNIIEKAVDKLEREATKGDVPVAPEPSAAGTQRAGREPPPAAPAEPARAAPRPTVGRRVELDLMKLQSQGFLTPDNSHGLVAEEHRLLKRPLLRRATPGDPEYVENGNLIIVTSSLPGEGKTYISINLAMSLAMEVDRHVLLVDADVAKSDVTRLMGLSHEKGLANFLAGEEPDLSKLLLRTNVDKLSVLPSGPHYAKLTEMLASEQMRSLVKELSGRYSDRVVVFDSPPLVATSSASVLSSLMGQVLMVVEAVRTPQSAVREAIRRLQVSGARNVSALLNKQRHGVSGSYSYYSYGYGYGYGSTPDTQ